MKRFCVGKVGNWGVIEWEDGIYPQMGDKLYSQPAELTDEEIANTWDDVRKDATLKSNMKDIQNFARAILKKASEK
jgi:hypothetical protein